ncbi:MAG: GNAT family N-acetyltransferase, partial [Ilumatobacteraceae bacterium]
DVSQSPSTFVSANRRKKIRRVLTRVDVEECSNVEAVLPALRTLYDRLVERHSITGIRALSPSAFTKQLTTPGTVLFRADHGGRTVGVTVWYVQENVAYGHLAAFSDEGYQLGASYALDWVALEALSHRVQWLDFGGGAGVEAGIDDGLTRYKRGWSTGTRLTYFCGRILNAEAYARLTSAASHPRSGYFPAYRAGEFGR